MIVCYSFLLLFVFNTVAQPCHVMFVTKATTQGNFDVDPGPDARTYTESLCEKEALAGMPSVKQPTEAGTMKFKVCVVECFYFYFRFVNFFLFFVFDTGLFGCYGARCKKLFRF